MCLRASLAWQEHLLKYHKFRQCWLRGAHSALYVGGLAQSFQWKWSDLENSSSPWHIPESVFGVCVSEGACSVHGVCLYMSHWKSWESLSSSLAHSTGFKASQRVFFCVQWKPASDFKHSRGQGFSCCKSIDFQGSWWGYANWGRLKARPRVAPDALPRWLRPHGQKALCSDSLWSRSAVPAVRHLANAMRFHQLSGQCEDASVARQSQAVATSYFVSLGGHLFSDVLVGHEQGVLCLFTLSLASVCFAERRMFPPPPDFLVCSVLPLSSREARGLFVILAVGPKQLMGGLRKNSLWRWRSMASEDQNHFAPASSQVWPFFSNPLGLDFMAEPLQLLPCLCCHLWTHCSTDSSKCMSNLFWGKKQQK